MMMWIIQTQGCTLVVLCFEWMGQTGSFVTVEIAVGAFKVDANYMRDNRGQCLTKN